MARTQGVALAEDPWRGDCHRSFFPTGQPVTHVCAGSSPSCFAVTLWYPKPCTYFTRAACLFAINDEQQEHFREAIEAVGESPLRDRMRKCIRYGEQLVDKRKLRFAAASTPT